VRGGARTKVSEEEEEEETHKLKAMEMHHRTERPCLHLHSWLKSEEWIEVTPMTLTKLATTTTTMQKKAMMTTKTMNGSQQPEQ
jgi:hypothetical protein